MDETREQWLEREFEIIWHQRNPDDWVAEVKDTHTDLRRRISSLEELERFIQTQLCLSGVSSGKP